jgi:hypothetical protein
MKNNLFIKVFVVFLFCAVFTVGVNAQNMFSKGDNILNLGVGIGSTLGGSGGSMGIPPLSVSYERGIIDQLFDDKSSLGLGAYLGYASHKWTGYTWSYTIFGVRGSVHYQLVDKLDTYGGLMLGYNSASVSGDWVGASASEMLWSLYIGGRYYFKENIAAFAELGYGIAYLQLGVSLKF